MQKAAVVPFTTLQALALKSILVRGMVESAGTFTTGMMTYFNKLTPATLGDGYATLLDRQWAASLTPLTFRWRMRDVARSLADALAPQLEARFGAPVALINIAGGPAADSLNALILLQKERPGLLKNRKITIDVLDLDHEGPHFGARALEALQAEGAPLAGLDVDFEYTSYDWTNPVVLQMAARLILAEGSAAAGSSEGGLFEYASDEDIVANLQALHDNIAPDFVMVGPVVRDASTLDPRLRGTEAAPNRPAVRYMGLQAFLSLATSAGWTISNTFDGPMHQVVSLRKS
jgi:hypothetical protein